MTDEAPRHVLLDYVQLSNSSLGWHGRDIVKVITASPSPTDPVASQFLASWPVAFLDSGRVYVTDAEDAPAATGIPNAGTYFFKPNDGSIASFSDGPEGPRRFVPTPQDPEQDDADSDEMLDVADDDPQELEFRFNVVGRHQGCILTRAGQFQCEACHIVPKTRGDIYHRLLRLEPGERLNVWSTEYAFLLYNGFRERFETFGWSFYVQDDETLIVHVFNRWIPFIQEFHGKVIPRRIFLVEERLHYLPPIFDFFRWHYAQAAKMYFRGFAWGVR